MKRVKKTDCVDTKPLSFEEALAKLEEVVARLEDGQLGLSESLAQYEQGVKHLQVCYHQLDLAEQKIELLAGVDARGNIMAEPFDEGEMSLQEKQAERSRRRSRSTSKSSQASSSPASGRQTSDGPAMDDPTALF